MRTLTTDRLVLRPWTTADAGAVLDIYSRWDVMRYIGVTPRVLEDREEALERVERWRGVDDGTRGVWAVVPVAGGAALPTARAYRWSARGAALRPFTRRSRRWRGVPRIARRARSWRR